MVSTPTSGRGAKEPPTSDSGPAAAYTPGIERRGTSSPGTNYPMVSIKSGDSKSDPCRLKFGTALITVASSESSIPQVANKSATGPNTRGTAPKADSDTHTQGYWCFEETLVITAKRLR